MNHKIARRLYQAMEAKYTADIMDARARISVYFESPVAIGEHPQITEEIDKLIGQKEYGHDIPTVQVDEDGKELLKG